MAIGDPLYGKPEQVLALQIRRQSARIVISQEEPPEGAQLKRVRNRVLDVQAALTVLGQSTYW